jgi:hypothetical protein
LQPNQYLPGSKTLTSEERRVAYRESHPYRQGVEQGYPLLIRNGEQLRMDGIRFTDLTQIFLSVDETTYSDDCCHTNQSGTDMLSERIAREILKSDLTRKAAK